MKQTSGGDLSGVSYVYGDAPPVFQSPTKTVIDLHTLHRNQCPVRSNINFLRSH
jgi:hypothetical protein